MVTLIRHIKVISTIAQNEVSQIHLIKVVKGLEILLLTISIIRIDHIYSSRHFSLSTRNL